MGYDYSSKTEYGIGKSGGACNLYLVPVHRQLLQQFMPKSFVLDEGDCGAIDRYDWSTVRGTVPAGKPKVGRCYLKQKGASQLYTDGGNGRCIQRPRQKGSTLPSAGSGLVSMDKETCTVCVSGRYLCRYESKPRMLN